MKKSPIHYLPKTCQKYFAYSHFEGTTKQVVSLSLPDTRPVRVIGLKHSNFGESTRMLFIINFFPLDDFSDTDVLAALSGGNAKVSSG